VYDGDHRPATQRRSAEREVSIWAVLNVTPDSFSDGGLYLAPAAAITRAKVMLAEGADVIDVGGASSRPRGATYGDGAAELSIEVERARVVPVVEVLARELGATVSIDTTSAEVADAAICAGACIVNDVSMGKSDALLAVVARHGVELVLMHTRGAGEVTPENTRYDDVVSDVARELGAACTRARSAGIDAAKLWVDPGLGFAKTAAQSTTLLAHVGALAALGTRVLVGASRKSFLGVITEHGGARPGPEARLPASLAAALVASREGADAVRVHDVAETRQALDTWLACERGRHA
jgi:dihydropteroate synthase